jgi:hypothetical protein
MLIHVVAGFICSHIRWRSGILGHDNKLWYYLKAEKDLWQRRRMQPDE